MKINCLSCGHNIELDDAYDDFEGSIKCYVCSGRLEVKFSEGKVKSVRLAAQPRGSLGNRGLVQEAEKRL
jgi:DNA-directed RNA polymerase subunit RPC12/RpoP